MARYNVVVAASTDPDRNSGKAFDTICLRYLIGYRRMAAVDPGSTIMPVLAELADRIAALPADRMSEAGKDCAEEFARTGDSEAARAALRLRCLANPSDYAAFADYLGAITALTDMDLIDALLVELNGARPNDAWLLSNLIVNRSNDITRRMNRANAEEPISAEFLEETSEFVDALDALEKNRREVEHARFLFAMLNRDQDALNARRTGRIREFLAAMPAAKASAIATELEFDAKRGDPIDAGAILRTHGVVVLRGVFSPDVLSLVQRRARELEPTSLVFSRCLRDCISPEDAERLFTTPFVAALLGQVMADFTPLNVDKCFVRRMVPGLAEGGTPFHQDIGAFARMEVNLWTPLEDCGDTNPNLQVAARLVDFSLATETRDPQWSGVEIDPTTVAQEFAPDELIAPIMRRGDAIAMLSCAVHRTHVAPGMTGTRDSVELRYQPTT